MDRVTYDETIDPTTILDRSLRESARPRRPLAWRRRWPAGLRGHAAVRRLVHRRHAPRIGRARRVDRGVVADPRVGGSARDRRGRRACSPRRSTTSMSTTAPAAWGSGPSSPTACTSPTARSPASARRGTRLAHCPASNLFLASGVMPLGALPRGGDHRGARARTWRAARISRSSRRCGWARMSRTRCASSARRRGESLGPLDWLRMGTLEGARALGLDDVDRFGRGRQGGGPHPRGPGLRSRRSPASRTTIRPTSMSRLIFRAHPDMVRATWVRGRRLDGPATRAVD